VWLDGIVALGDRDAGCGGACAALERYVEAELRGEDAAAGFPGIAVHLGSCPACRTDHDGLLALSDPSPRAPTR
jgi:hypothetical protein